MAVQRAPADVFRPYGRKELAALLRRSSLTEQYRREAQAVAEVLPFRTNSYVVDHLIDWSAVPDDPMFRLTLPQPDMLPLDDRLRVAGLLDASASRALLGEAVRGIRSRLNPHPAGQLERNVPTAGRQGQSGEQDERGIPGIQHKYRETVLFFPRRGQTCHAYCTYCFRWAQFVGDTDLKFTGDVEPLVRYLREHTEVTDVLVTGGDPLVMSAGLLARCVEPLLDGGLEHVSTIRLGTKSLSYWPHRFLTDPDSEELLALFRRIVAAGRHLVVMAHYSHPRELSTDVALEAVRRVRETGATVRVQAPVIRGVNDEAGLWTELWSSAVRLGMVPYYMFVERDTGPQDYFAVPLVRAWEIFRDSAAQVSGLGRTARGPVMSADEGKVCVDGVLNLGDDEVFVLRYLQARRPSWVGRPFLARFDPRATWFSQLAPVSGIPDSSPWSRLPGGLTPQGAGAGR
ncbi:KamA family protein [Streptomyces phaeochromogenes]|uniref:KamA family radical SAM protein n=1 Tax=Streptomyces phaeochromogenes TaxID=1923 RepID=UPI0027916B59|nr:lysine 2,3-aminomutase [Streptomyces phaeochromogenes]MDQ0950876.1 KamA family protein [Streptomyces phaeochromogenes]